MATPRAASVLERGTIYFAYRPKVQAQTAHGFDDVQRFYVVLSPRGKASYRLIVIGQKKLPAVTGPGDRMAWGFVEEVSGRPEHVEDELDPRRYFTETHGERGQPAARPAGEGVYAIARHHRGEAQRQRARSAPRTAARDGGDGRDLYRAEDGEVTAPCRATARGEMGVGAASATRQAGASGATSRVTRWRVRHAIL
jgi:hypothetical protein